MLVHPPDRRFSVSAGKEVNKPSLADRCEESSSCPAMRKLHNKIESDGKEHLLQLSGGLESWFNCNIKRCYFKPPDGDTMKSVTSAIMYLEEQWAALNPGKQPPAGMRP